MLACADARPRTKRKETIWIDLEWVALAPSIRVKLEWIFIKLLLKMVGLYLNRYYAALFDGYLAYVVVSHCYSSEYAIIWSIHSQSFLEDIIIVSHFFEILISEIIDRNWRFEVFLDFFPQFLFHFRIQSEEVNEHACCVAGRIGSSHYKSNELVYEFLNSVVILHLIAF